MPVSVANSLHRLDQDTFKQIAHAVVGTGFDIHRRLGRFFDESVYQRAVADRLKEAETEIQIIVTFKDYRKDYFVDLIISKGAVFELKAVNQLNNEHRNQLVNYLLLTGLQHGKLLNFGGESMEHEFVNAKIGRSQRRAFCMEDQNWEATRGFGDAEKKLAVDFLRDLGTGLSVPLYEEIFTHFFADYRKVQVTIEGSPVGAQPTRMCAPGIGLKVTAFNDRVDDFERQIRRFLGHTSLTAIQWVNIALQKVTFSTIKEKV